MASNLAKKKIENDEKIVLNIIIIEVLNTTKEV
jgi:hypothetical protein